MGYLAAAHGPQGRFYPIARGDRPESPLSHLPPPGNRHMAHSSKHGELGLFELSGLSDHTLEPETHGQAFLGLLDFERLSFLSPTPTHPTPSR